MSRSLWIGILVLAFFGIRRMLRSRNNRTWQMMRMGNWIMRNVDVPALYNRSAKNIMQAGRSMMRGMAR
ncbi:hypothetical protein [Aneurinibacillus tyrosinisolvens]|uniref:hypothetical protein n=1 Tax=Aneurinibacillus tyrosinisolvens TaxID=1443435 RepID=UPI00063F74C9|nr:hypothetical protein [Aneurinibacillus tyrosinisolvens]